MHGFGFASVLEEAQLPTDRLAAALFGFNLGVEAGQLAIVAALWPVLRWLAKRQPAARVSLIEFGSAAVLALGVYWFIARAYAGALPVAS